jgi:hypothetical protein
MQAIACRRRSHADAIAIPDFTYEFVHEISALSLGAEARAWIAEMLRAGVALGRRGHLPKVEKRDLGKGLAHLGSRATN